ncbi:DUF1015 domain-containing protein [Halochromatium roseum]|uniref:DUF1015 domain-containing protein n=1 Tax=Halochromatium roseum TaxID=391920 RepID=UPI0019140FC5|nr:DUF1015 family protein [Halochromatium roseum]MBK5941135.1 hypothetical protein [Halochromatium roseum]
MSLIAPFAGLRPRAELAAEVAAPPYDVMSTAEARAMVQGRPLSFLHISRAEVDLPEGTDPYSEAVYAKARENLERLRADGTLQQDPTPRYYAYRLSLGEHQQTGLVAAASVAAYLNGQIRRHELTRPAKEQDRVRQISALNAQTGPVFLAYRAASAIDKRLQAICQGPSAIDIRAADGVRHQLWSIDADDEIAAFDQAFAAVDRLYIADGHHRAAAAARVAEARQQSATAKATPNANANPTTHTTATTQATATATTDATTTDKTTAAATTDGEAKPQPSDHFLAVLFAHDQLRILPYNRVVRDLNGLKPDRFLDRIAASYRIEPSAQPVAPTERGEVGLYLAGLWYRLTLSPERIPATDPIGRLDVSLLHDQLIEPVLGITDPRRDERIDFVGGIRGLEGLSARVDSGEMAVAFSLPATRMEDLLAVADADALMPPKSTWFEPKLADGLVSHLLE